MRYRIKEIKEPFRRRQFRVQRRVLGIWLTVYGDELPVEFESIEKAQAWIAEAHSGKMVRIHEQPH